MALLHLLGIIDCECGCGAQECFKDSLAASYLFIISYSVHATGQSRCFIYYYLCDGYNELHVRIEMHHA